MRPWLEATSRLGALQCRAETNALSLAGVKAGTMGWGTTLAARRRVSVVSVVVVRALHRGSFTHRGKSADAVPDEIRPRPRDVTLRVFSALHSAVRWVQCHMSFLTGRRERRKESCARSSPPAATANKQLSAQSGS